MKSEAQQFIESWERQKAKGQWRFIARSGGIWAGLFFLVQCTLELAEHSFREAFWSSLTLKHLAVGIIAAIPFGIVQYYLMEYSYKKYLKKRDGEV